MDKWINGHMGIHPHHQTQLCAYPYTSISPSLPHLLLELQEVVHAACLGLKPLHLALPRLIPPVVRVLAQGHPLEPSPPPPDVHQNECGEAEAVEQNEQQGRYPGPLRDVVLGVMVQMVLARLVQKLEQPRQDRQVALFRKRE